MDFSTVFQIDGLHALNAMPWRPPLPPRSLVTTDALVPSVEFISASLTPLVMATVASHHGYGIFIVPEVPSTKPALKFTVKNTGGTCTALRYEWYDYLMSRPERIYPRMA